MHFETVLKHLLELFKEKEVEYALIGGVGLGLLGIQRATVDLDFMILIKDIGLVDKYMLSHGYSCLVKNDEFGSYLSKNPILGRVDFMFANTGMGQKMLKRSLLKTYSDELSQVAVLQPEDIIGLKLLALTNNKKRFGKDALDIKEIFRVYGKKLDLELVLEYAKIYSKEKEIQEFIRDEIN